MGRPPKAVETDTLRAVVLRDFWPEADQRVYAGTIIDVTRDELIDGLMKGTLAKHEDAAKPED
jgi:hypothetical protein